MAAQRGARFHFIYAVLQTSCSCSEQMRALFYLKRLAALWREPPEALLGGNGYHFKLAMRCETSCFSKAIGNSGKEKTNKHKHFRRDGVRATRDPSLGQTGPVPGTSCDPSLGQTGRFRLILQCNRHFVPFVPGAGGCSSLWRSEKPRIRLGCPSRSTFFTGSSKVTSCGFWQKRVRLSDLLEGS